MSGRRSTAVIAGSAATKQSRIRILLVRRTPISHRRCGVSFDSTGCVVHAGFAHFVRYFLAAIVSSQGMPMAWIFQGNPRKFEIDEYVARYPELIYWYTPRHASEIQLGDRVFLWRSGDEAGAIAIGSVVEEPTLGANVKHPSSRYRPVERGQT